MADTVTFEIKGLSALQKTLENIPEQLAKQGIRKSLKAGAAPVKEAMSIDAPKDSGFLSENFGTRTKMLHGHDIGGSIFIGPEGHVKYPDGQHMTALKVASLNEFGHQTRGPEGEHLHGKAKDTRHAVAPNPFMTRAWERTKAAALQALTDTLRLEVLTAALQKAMGVK
jgi:hypothetical protein